MAEEKKNYLVAIHEGLDANLEKQVAALPKNFNKQRFLQNCMTVLQDGRADFSSCEPKSVVRTLLKGAFLGLDFFNGECYAIPYKGNVTFQTDYKGEIKLAKLYSSNPIQDIYAKVVREGDEFEEHIENGRQTVSFKPKTFNDGEIIGAFAVCLYKDGGMIYDTMSKAEIDHTRNVFSKAANSQAWKESYGEMAKKTVLRRLCKLIDLNFDTAEAMQAFEDGSAFDVKEKPKEKYEAHDIYVESDQGETHEEAAETIEVAEVIDAEGVANGSTD